MASITMSVIETTQYTVEHLGNNVWSTTDYDYATRLVTEINTSPAAPCVDCGQSFPVMLVDFSASSRPCPAEEGKEGVHYGHRVKREAYDAYVATTPKAARQRVAEFVRQWEIRSSQPDYQHTVYSVHYDAKTDEGGVLTIDDLKTLLGA